MSEMKTISIEIVGEETGGEWACMVACIGGCAAAAVVFPAAAGLNAFATVASLL